MQEMASVAARVLALALTLAACGGSSATPVDAQSDAATSTCEGACRTTSLAATFGAVQRQLDRAYYGITTTAAGASLHVEAYRGGAAGCPTQSAPATDYTLVLGSVPISTGMTAVTSPANLLDLVGDLLPNNQLGAAATAVTITPVATEVCMGCDGFLAFEASLTFAAGTITGHLFATHCDELDEQQ
jgi:hypothetical protein